MKIFTPKKKADGKEEHTEKPTEKPETTIEKITSTTNQEYTENGSIKQVETKVEEPKVDTPKPTFGFNAKKQTTQKPNFQKTAPEVQQKEEIKKIQPIDTPQKFNAAKPKIHSSVPSTEQVKKLVEIMAQKHEYTINPKINFDTNQITYPILSEINEDENNMDYLEELVSETTGILEREVSERLLVCPQHPEDLTTSVRMYCPECSSMDIQRLHLIEHKVCGYIAEKEEYGVISVNDVRTCPNCKRQVKDFKKEIRMPGQWNKCNNCEKKFDDAIIRLHCRRFNHDFNLQEVESIPVPSYKIKQEAGSNADTLTLIPELKKIIISLGFTVSELSSIKGNSGVSHPTSIYAENNEGKTIAIFIKTAKEIIDDTEVNSTLVNVLDINPTWTVFVGIPAVSEKVQAMASAHKMIIVTGKDLNKIASEIEKRLHEKITISRVNT